MKRAFASVLGLALISALSVAAPAFARGPGPSRPAPAHVYKAPKGSLVIFNQSGATQRITVGGMNLGLLRPGAQKVVELEVGRHAVTFTSTARFSLSHTEVVHISPREREALRILPAAATLRVKNPYRFAVTLTLDGRRVGTIAPGATITVSGLDFGRTEVSLLRGRQMVSQQSVRITRGVNLWSPNRYAFTTPGFEIAWR